MEQENKKEEMLPISNSLNIPDILTLLPVYTAPMFPGIMVPLTISNENVFQDLDKDLKVGQFIGIFLVRKKYEQLPLYEIKVDMVYKMGTVGRIIKKIYLPNGSVNLLINCLYRVEIENEEPSKGTLQRVKVIDAQEIEKKNDLETKVLIKTIMEQMEYIAHSNPFVADQIKSTVNNAASSSRIADFFISILGDIPKEKLQELLETTKVRSRLQKIAILMEERINVLKVQEKIVTQINNKVEKQQRDFFLREQLKSIKEELGLESDPKMANIEKFKQRLENIKKNYDSKEVIENLETALSRLETSDSRSPDYSIEQNYLETSLFLPWYEKVDKIVNMDKAKRILDETHYGITDIKNRILEFLAVQKLKPEAKGAVICFVGPPGVGKTSLGKSIAQSLSRPFFRFSVGGMRDEAEIKGHRRTYIGAMPGKIIQGLNISKYNNPVFMIDEIDKLGSSFQGDPASALLEVLDPEQNVNFRDHYVDLPFDLSNVLFITTANVLSTIPPPLLDRMEIISLHGYISEEKYMIGKNHILDKQKERHGLALKDFTLTKKAFLYIAEKYSREAGIRNFEQQIAKLCRKLAYKKALNEEIPSIIDVPDLYEYLGNEIFNIDDKKRIKAPGVSIGLAWTSMGGDTLYIESILVPSQGNSFKLTGQLGDVMKESAEIAYAYIRSIAKKHHIDLKLLTNNTIHLHVPAGAVPKDGPSAGITMAVALYSLLTGKKVPQNFAMTGELTLTGSVLPIGGLKEKSLAAVRANIKNIIAPAENERNLEDIPELVKKQITYHFVSKLEDVFDILFKES
jgi:ATP-dependent Lon protease